MWALYRGVYNITYFRLPVQATLARTLTRFRPLLLIHVGTNEVNRVRVFALSVLLPPEHSARGLHLRFAREGTRRLMRGMGLIAVRPFYR